MGDRSPFVVVIVSPQISRNSPISPSPTAMKWILWYTVLSKKVDSSMIQGSVQEEMINADKTDVFLNAITANTLATRPANRSIV
jgi:hypothetical protein